MDPCPARSWIWSGPTARQGPGGFHPRRLLDQMRKIRPGQGARANGWTVAVPGYTLAPEARISEITREIGTAIGKAAALVERPIRLTC